MKAWFMPAPAPCAYTNTDEGASGTRRMAEIDEPGLRIPHPRLHERRFVLEPLAELDPSLEVPGKGAVQALLAELH